MANTPGLEGLAALNLDLFPMATAPFSGPIGAPEPSTLGWAGLTWLGTSPRRIAQR